MRWSTIEIPAFTAVDKTNSLATRAFDLAFTLEMGQKGRMETCNWDLMETDRHFTLGSSRLFVRVLLT